MKEGKREKEKTRERGKEGKRERGKEGKRERGKERKRKRERGIVKRVSWFKSSFRHDRVCLEISVKRDDI